MVLPLPWDCLCHLSSTGPPLYRDRESKRVRHIAADITAPVPNLSAELSRAHPPSGILPASVAPIRMEGLTAPASSAEKPGKMSREHTRKTSPPHSIGTPRRSARALSGEGCSRAWRLIPGSPIATSALRVEQKRSKNLIPKEIAVKNQSGPVAQPDRATVS